MHAFQEFQSDFGRYLRDPQGRPRPAGVPVRRAKIYGELLFNNLEGFLLACFPVTRQVLGPRRWTRLVREFFRNARCQTPYFREIPREFLHWLTATATLPVAVPLWLRELAHYEWAELALDVMETVMPPCQPDGDLLADIPVLTPALMNLSYTWPVQRIGPGWRPRKPPATPVQLLVFRDAQDDVQFIALNPVMARLITLLQAGNLSGRAACLQIAAEIGHQQAEVVVAHGGQVLADLRTAGAILGSRP